MNQCKVCGAPAGPAGGESAAQLCSNCMPKQLFCRVCEKEFSYGDILEDLPVVQCPTCQGPAIDEI